MMSGRLLSCVMVSCLLFTWSEARAQSPGRAGGAARLVLALEAYGSPRLLSPDGRVLALAGEEEVAVYDVATGAARWKAPLAAPRSPKHGFFTPDGKTLVVQTDRVRVYDAEDGRLVREFAAGTAPVNHYKRIYTGSEQTTYDESTGGYTTNHYPPSDAENLSELPALEPGDRVVSPDWKLMLVRGAAGAAEVYDFETGAHKFTLAPATGGGLMGWLGLRPAALGEFSPDGRFVLTAHGDPSPRLWDAATGKLVADLAPHSHPVYGARFSPDGRFIATTSFDGVVKAWDGATGKLLHVFGSAQGPTYFAAWSPRSDTFVTKSRAWEVCLWEAASGRLVAKLDHKAAKEKFDQNLTFVFSPDGTRLLTRGRDSIKVRTVLTLGLGRKPKRIAHLWDTASGKLVASLRDTKWRIGSDYINDSFLWSPGGGLIVSAGAAVKLWRPDGTHAQELEGNGLLGAAFSRDGKTLVAGHAPQYPFNLKVVVKAMVGKPQKDLPYKTHVWKIEGPAAAVSSR